MEQTKPQPAAQGTKYKGSHLQSSYGEDFAPKVRAPLPLFRFGRCCSPLRLGRARPAD